MKLQSVELRVPDAEAAARFFATVWGLAPAESNGAIRLRSMALASVFTIASCPISSANVCGRYLRASTRYGPAAPGADASGRSRPNDGSSMWSLWSGESDIATLFRSRGRACRSLIADADSDLFAPFGARAEIEIGK